MKSNGASTGIRGVYTGIRFLLSIHLLMKAKTNDRMQIGIALNQMSGNMGIKSQQYQSKEYASTIQINSSPSVLFFMRHTVFIQFLCELPIQS